MLDDMCKKSREVSLESQKLSQLACAFEESVRITRDSDNSEKSDKSLVDSERRNRPLDTAGKSLDVSVMERCLAAMNRSSCQPSQEPEEQEGLVSRHLADDEDDDEDCDSLLASLSELQTQLQQEIRQTHRRLHDSKRGVEEGSQEARTSLEETHRRLHGLSESGTTRCETKRGDEDSSQEARTGVNEGGNSRLEETGETRRPSEESCDSRLDKITESSLPVNHALTTTTATCTATTSATTTTTGGCC